MSTAEAGGTAPEPPIMSRSVPVNRLVGENETSRRAKIPIYRPVVVSRGQEFSADEPVCFRITFRRTTSFHCGAWDEVRLLRGSFAKARAKLQHRPEVRAVCS